MSVEENKKINKQCSIKVVEDSNDLQLYETTRPILTEKGLREQYSFSKLPANNALKGTVRYCAKRYKPSGNCLLNYFFERIPFFRWILDYDLKNDFAKDAIAGLTIGILNTCICILFCLNQ